MTAAQTLLDWWQGTSVWSLIGTLAVGAFTISFAWHAGKGLGE